MSIKYVEELLGPGDIKKEFPLSSDYISKKAIFDKEISDILQGKSNKFLVIIGPCSADNEDSVCDYAARLAKVQEKVRDKLLLIPRIYTNKPRTTGDGYKGMLHQPDPEKKPNIHEGIVAIRRMHLKVIEESELFTADEMLYPENLSYLDDLMSYISVGARSVENQHHRLTASGCDVPVGMKNPTSGDLTVMLNSIYAAQQAHDFIFRGYSAQTTGNPLSHAILRGAVDKNALNIPNYHYEDLEHLYSLYMERDLKNPALIVDANHANSNKKHMEQIRIVKEVLHSRRYSKDIENLVKGVMIESYIEAGNQKIGEHIYGKSITDPCLDWNNSEKLLLEMAEIL